MRLQSDHCLLSLSISFPALLVFSILHAALDSFFCYLSRSSWAALLTLRFTLASLGFVTKEVAISSWSVMIAKGRMGNCRHATILSLEAWGPFYCVYQQNDMTTVRMRWGDILMPLLKKYKLNITWGDQDLLNIIFFHNPGNHLIS